MRYELLSLHSLVMFVVSDLFNGWANKNFVAMISKTPLSDILKQSQDRRVSKGRGGDQPPPLGPNVEKKSMVKIYKM